MTKLRIFLFVFFIVVVGVLIVFPYRNKAAVNIAFLGRLSGNGSAYDISACNGAILAVSSLNSRGGIKGRQVRLTLYDYKNQSGELETICAAMKEKKSSLLLAPYFQRKKLLHCLGTDPILPLGFGFPSSGIDRQGVAVYPMVASLGTALAELALLREIRNMAVLYDGQTYPFGLAFLEGFRRSFQEGGGRILEELAFNSSSAEKVEEFLVSVNKAGPEGVLIIASATLTGKIGRRIASISPTVKLFAAPWVVKSELDGTLERASDPNWFHGLESLSGYTEHHSGNGATVPGPFYREYQERYGNSPDLSAIFGYEAILILAEGIRNSASPDSYLVKHTLEKMARFKGMVSDYTLDGKTQVGASEMALFEVMDGKPSKESQ